MKFGGWVTNRILRVLATGRVPVQGALFRVSNPKKHKVRFLRPSPDELGSRSKCFSIYIHENSQATFLVIKVQDSLPLWKMWVQVMFSDETDNTVIGWLPYHEFNDLVRPCWDTWDEEENQ